MLAAIAKGGGRRYGRRPLMIPNGWRIDRSLRLFRDMAGLRVPVDANREDMCDGARS
jgi:hypothetical protein